MSIHKTTPEFNATFNYVCVPQSFAADGRQMDTVDFPDSPANTTACELALETPWLLQHTLYQYAIQDIVNHWQAIDATQPVSTRLSDRSIVRTFLQTYGLWEVDQPKGVWASMRFFQDGGRPTIALSCYKRFAHRVCTNSLAGEASPKASGLRRLYTEAGRGGRMSARCTGSHLRTNEPKSGGRCTC